MKERPILFSAPMVRAILEGRKTQTRRVVKYPAAEGKHGWFPEGGSMVWRLGGSARPVCPYGQPGDRLWVREKFKTAHDEDNLGDCIEYADGTKIKPVVPDNNTGFRFSWDCDNDNVRWRPSIHMPRWASRITLEVVSVRVERLQEISEADALAEGIDMESSHASLCINIEDRICGPGDSDLVRGSAALTVFKRLWQSINGPDSWEANPWVWVIEFKRI